MSFIRHKKINGQIYAYEVTGYRDEITKKSRQKVKYIGAVDKNGNIITKDRLAEELILDFGDTYLIHNFLKKLPIFKILEEVFSENSNELLSLLYYKLCYPSAMYHAETWFEGNFAKILFTKSNLSSQKISVLLSNLGNETLQRKFFTLYLSELKEKVEGIIIDGTPLPNKINVGFNAWGHNCGSIDEQMRFLCVIDQKTSAPLFFRYLPGNIIDVSTLKATMLELKEYGIKNNFLLMDAGYFSKENVIDLYNEKINFLTRLPSSNKIYQNLVNENISDLENFKNGVSLGTRGLFIKKVPLNLYEKKASPKSYLELKEVLKSNGQEVVETENKYGAFAYIISDPERKGREISKLLSQSKDNTPEKNESLLKLSGVFILISSFEIRESDVVPYYYLRQQVEQVFGFFKDDLNVLPLRTHNDETVKGYLFLTFINLIIFLECRKMLKNKFTVEQALMVMRNLKCKIFNNHLIIHELTKKQKEITKLFDIEVPKNLKIADCCA